MDNLAILIFVIVMMLVLVWTYELRIASLKSDIRTLESKNLGLRLQQALATAPADTGDPFNLVDLTDSHEQAPVDELQVEYAEAAWHKRKTN